LPINVDHVNMNGMTLVGTDEVARRLGVKRETVYAYVSRGLLTRHAGSRRRASLFDAAEVERLAARARRTDRSGALEVVVDTQLTLLDPDGRLFYRGRDAVELARFRTFEQVTALLWDEAPRAAWELTEDAATVLAGLTAALPEAAADTDRIAVAVAGLAATDPRADRRHPDAVRDAGATILAGALDALPVAGAPAADRSAAARLWAALTPAPGRPAARAALDAALVLLADHELAASTLAGRVAASAWAGPYHVVLSGLGPLGGVLHGRAPRTIEALLAEVVTPADAYEVLGRRMDAAGQVPGFGHRVYRDRDPRADHLLPLATSLARDPARARRVEAVVEAADALGLRPPNVDLAVCALAHALELRRDAPTTIFTVARIAGLVAHALEEYPHRLRFRPRASYVGPAPRQEPVRRLTS
jgi:citrate synthase